MGEGFQSFDAPPLKLSPQNSAFCSTPSGSCLLDSSSFVDYFVNYFAKWPKQEQCFTVSPTYELKKRREESQERKEQRERR